MLDRFLKRSFFLSISQVLSSLLSYIFILIIARYFGTELFGKFIFSYSLIILLSYLSDFGLTTLIVREISNNKDESLQILFHAITIRLFLSIIIYIGLFICINSFIIVDSEKKSLMMTLGIILFTKSFIELSLSYLLGKEDQTTYGWLQFLDSFLLVLLAYSFIEYGLNFLLISNSIVVASCTSIIIGYFILFKNSNINIIMSISILISLLKKMIPFGLTMFVTVFCAKIGILMLSALTNDYSVGQFGAVYRLIEGLLFFPIVLTKMLYPVFSNQTISIKNIEFIINYSIKILISIASFIIIFGFIFSKDIIIFLYSSSFGDSDILFDIMLWSLFAYFPNYILGHALFSLHKHNLVLFVTVLNLIVTIVTNYYFILYFGLLGATYAVLISALVPLIGYIICLRNKIHIYDIQTTLFKSFIITIIIIITGLLIKDIVSTLPLIIFLLTIYLISNYIFKIIVHNDLVKIKELINNKIS